MYIQHNISYFARAHTHTQALGNTQICVHDLVIYSNNYYSMFVCYERMRVMKAQIDET